MHICTNSNTRSYCDIFANSNHSAHKHTNANKHADCNYTTNKHANANGNARPSCAAAHILT